MHRVALTYQEELLEEIRDLLKELRREPHNPSAAIPAKTEAPQPEIKKKRGRPPGGGKSDTGRVDRKSP